MYVLLEKHLLTIFRRQWFIITFSLQKMQDTAAETIKFPSSRMSVGSRINMFDVPCIPEWSRWLDTTLVWYIVNPIRLSLVLDVSIFENKIIVVTVVYTTNTEAQLMLSKLKAV